MNDILFQAQTNLKALPAGDTFAQPLQWLLAALKLQLPSLLNAITQVRADGCYVGSRLAIVVFVVCRKLALTTSAAAWSAW